MALVVIICLAGLALQHVIPAYVVYGLIIISVCVYIYIERKKFQATLDWTHNPENIPPIDCGQNELIITPLYKALRRRTWELEDQIHINKTSMRAAYTLPAAVIILDEEYRLMWCNRAAYNFLGLQSDSDKDNNLFNVIRVPEVIEYVSAHNFSKPLIFDYENQKNRTLQLEVTPYANTGFVLFISDITQLEKLRKIQQDFVANVSHELRTPLTVLIGFLETLQSLPPESLSLEKRQQYQENMLEQAQQMLAIVTDLLTLSTLEATTMTGGKGVSLNDILCKSLHQAQALSKDKHHFIVKAEPNIVAFGKATELASAMSNLLNNAVHYTPEGGTITVKLYKKGKHPVFSVTDTGIGIKAKHISHLTERFYRVDRSRSRATGGTGLGLAITKYIALRHNIELKIESEVNKGSTFSLIFPNTHKALKKTED